MPLTQIGPYKVVRELGRGGMGEVFLATDTRLDRQVAIKALPVHLAQDQDRLARFQREAKVLASLNHPNIAAIYGLEEAAGHQYLILEFVEGETLADQLKGGAIPIDETLRLAKQITEALEAAHEKGVIHRDLKPGNVMVTGDGVVKVLDFGLARSADGTPSSSNIAAIADSPTVTSPAPVHSPTIPGAIMGTAGYMSPEQARGKPVDKRSDIFSFGCVLYEMLTGAQPFAGETVTDSLGAILHREPNWAMLPPGTPARVRELLSHCLAKDRKSRLHDIADARLALEQAISGKEWVAVATEVRPRNKLLTISLGLVAAVVLLGLGAGLWRAFGPQPSAGNGMESACVSVAMPTDISVQSAGLTRDGRTLIAIGKPKDLNGAKSEQPRIYTRRLDNYEFKALAGTEGVLGFLPTRDGRSLLFIAPITPGASQRRANIVPLDGSAPATTIVELKDSWFNFMELENGDLLVQEGELNFVRIPKASGVPSAPVKVETDRPGVSRVELVGRTLPEGRGVLVNVVSYGSRGFQFSVGVMDPATGHVKVVVEDGGQPAYSPTGHLLFSRGDVLLAVPFDLQRAEVRGTPAAVWSGLDSFNRAFPAPFNLTDQGTLCYRPGQSGRARAVAILGTDGKLEPWSSERREFSSQPFISPDGRRVACQILNAQAIDQLWISPLDHDEFIRLGSEAKVDSFFPIWSPDGGQVAYIRVGKDGRDGIYIQGADGGEARRLLKVEVRDQYFYPTAWLPDNSGLLITRIVAGKLNLMLLPLGDKELDPADLRPFLPSEFNRLFAIVSKDGRMLAFISEETGVGQVWLAEMKPNGETGRPIQVRTSRVTTHGLAADGKSLFIQDERNRLLKFTINPGPPLSVSAPIEIADLEKLSVQFWAPLPDGRFFTFLKAESEGDLKRYDLVLNWTELLKKKVPVPR